MLYLPCVHKLRVFLGRQKLLLLPVQWLTRWLFAGVSFAPRSFVCFSIYEQGEASSVNSCWTVLLWTQHARLSHLSSVAFGLTSVCLGLAGATC